MNPSEQNSITESSGSGDFESTLRLIARLSAPQGLEERIQAGLRAAPASASGGSRILAWPTALRADAVWMRSAAAAAIVAVVVGGGWGISSHFQPNRPTSAIAVPVHGAGQTGQVGQTGQGGFSSAGAMRTPQTLNGPVVAQPATATPQTTKPAAKTPARRGKPTAAKKAVTQTAPAAK